jgi:hypothetical protein
VKRTPNGNKLIAIEEISLHHRLEVLGIFCWGGLNTEDDIENNCQ